MPACVSMPAVTFDCSFVMMDGAPLKSVKRQSGVVLASRADGAEKGPTDQAPKKSFSVGQHTWCWLPAGGLIDIKTLGASWTTDSTDL